MPEIYVLGGSKDTRGYDSELVAIVKERTQLVATFVQGVSKRGTFWLFSNQQMLKKILGAIYFVASYDFLQ